MDAWGSLKAYTLHAYSERYSPSIRHDGPNVRTYDADAVDALLARLRPAFRASAPSPTDTPSDPFTCSKCGGPTKESGRWHPDLGTIYGYELGLGDATCGKRIAPERKAHKVHPSGKTLIWAGPGPAPETEGESRGETVAAYREALQEIATRPTVERNPDGDDQAAETMQLLARETLAAHGELRPAMPNMPEAESRVRKPAHNDAKERGE